MSDDVSVHAISSKKAMKPLAGSRDGNCHLTELTVKSKRFPQLRKCKLQIMKMLVCKLLGVRLLWLEDHKKIRLEEEGSAAAKVLLPFAAFESTATKFSTEALHRTPVAYWQESVSKAAFASPCP